MKLNYISADSRGNVQNDWLNSHHTYSFGRYYNPARMNFGTLRVINDDEVAPGEGFGKHPHDNMEIVSIPTSGKLIHHDSMGNHTEIVTGEVQAMSAGKSVIHSEMNGSQKEPVKFFQIWIETREQGIEPSYSQKKFEKTDRHNQWQLVVAPDSSTQDVVRIHQDAWFHLGDFEPNQNPHYSLKDSSNGVFLFIIKGQVKLDDKVLSTRDGVEISETERFDLKVLKSSELLVMEVPMN